MSTSIERYRQLVPKNLTFIYKDQQYTIVKDIIKQSQCQQDIILELAPKLYQTNARSLGTLLKDHPYDHQIKNNNICLLDAMKLQGQKRDYTTLNSIITLDQEIAAGQSGKVLNLNIGGNQVLALKTLTNKSYDAYNNLEYETFIGFVLNSLSSKLPTFMHTYGLIYCPDGEDKLCAASGTKVAKLIVENIHGEIIANSLIDETTTLNVLLQIINALALANREFGFVHYDLNSGNVIIVPLKEEISIPLYMPNGEIKYIVTKFLVKIIDFGFSRIKLNGTTFYPFDIESSGITKDNNQAYDLRRLLIALYPCPNFMSSEIILSLCKYLELDIDDIDADNYWAKLRGLNSKPITYDYIFQVIFDKFSSYLDTFITDNYDDTTILGICSECYNWKDYINAVFDEDKLPRTLIEFVDAYQASQEINNEDRRIQISDFLLTTPISELYQEEKTINLEKLQELSANIDTLNTLSDREHTKEDNVRLLYHTIVLLEYLQLWVARVKILTVMGLIQDPKIDRLTLQLERLADKIKAKRQYFRRFTYSYFNREIMPLAQYIFR